MTVPDDIVEYINEVGPEPIHQHSYLEQVTDMGCTLELDRPNVDIKGPDGSLIARMTVPTALVVTNVTMPPGMPDPEL